MNYDEKNTIISEFDIMIEDIDSFKIRLEKLRMKLKKEWGI